MPQAPLEVSQTPSRIPQAASKTHTLEEKKITQGDAILAGMLGQGSAASTEQAIPVNTPTQASSVRSELNPEMMNRLVDSILVSANDSKQEVLIKVQNTVLPDTQIMVRIDEGKLFVDMQTQNTDSSFTLHQNLATLRERLQNSCKDTDIFIKVSDNTAHDGRSQNGQQGSGHSEDRSRGNFLWDAAE